jgi:WD40 repeat protein
LDEPGEDGPSEHTSHSAAESVWAGGTDGRVRMWAGLGQQEGVLASTWSFAAHDEAVSAVDMHPYAGVMATCSGAREWDLSARRSTESRRESHRSDEESEGDSRNEDIIDEGSTMPTSQDRSLQIWSIAPDRRP